MRTPRFWQQKNMLSAALAPLSWLYAFGAWADRRFTVPARAQLPVISIGNATAGGAGKTPVTLALVPILRALGHAPHILTRGYGGEVLIAHRVTATDDWRMVGDEALLLAQAAPTWVGRNRLASARAAANAGATILLCDDAHQHHALAKDVALLVLDGPFGIGNGALIPAGPLREPFAAAAARADALIMIGDDAHGLADGMPLPVFCAQLNLAGESNFLRDGKWLAFAGIGRPEKFYTTLKNLGATLAATRDFPDHHAYVRAEIQSLQHEAARLGAGLITTTKDAVKIPADLREGIIVLPVDLVFGDGWLLQQWLIEKLRS